MIYCNSCHDHRAGEKVIYCQPMDNRPVERQGAFKDGLALVPSWCPKREGGKLCQPAQVK